MPDRAHYIFQHFEAQNQKAILDDEEAFFENNDGLNSNRNQKKYSGNQIGDSQNSGDGFLNPIKEGQKQARSVSRGRP